MVHGFHARLNQSEPLSMRPGPTSTDQPQQTTLKEENIRPQQMELTFKGKKEFLMASVMANFVNLTGQWGAQVKH